MSSKVLPPLSPDEYGICAHLNIAESWCCNILTLGSLENTVVGKPKIRANKNFLNCLTNACVSLLIAVFNLVLFVFEFVNT